MNNLFWVVILEMPKQKKDEETRLPTVLFGPVVEVAKTEMAAALKVSTNCAALKGKDFDRIQVVVRPF